MIGLACSGKEIYHFCFVLLCIRGQIAEGRFNRGSFALRFGGGGGAYIWRGLFSEFYGSLRVSCDKISVVILNTDDNEEIKINSEGLADEIFLCKM